MSLVEQLAAALGTPRGNLQRQSVYLETAAHKAQTRESRRALLRDRFQAQNELASSEGRFPAPARKVR